MIRLHLILNATALITSGEGLSMLHLLCYSSIHLVCRSILTGLPGIPSGPGSPTSPRGPELPGDPRGPLAPLGPGSPCHNKEIE